MCTTITINNNPTDTIGGVKILSKTFYSLMTSYVNDPWSDEDCLCTVDFANLIKDNKYLNIVDNSTSSDREYSLTIVEPDTTVAQQARSNSGAG